MVYCVKKAFFDVVIMRMFVEDIRYPRLFGDMCENVNGNYMTIANLSIYSYLPFQKVEELFKLNMLSSMLQK